MQRRLAAPNASDTGLSMVRMELQERLARWLDAPLTALGLVMLALLVVEWTVDLAPTWASRFATIQGVIWGIFIIDFVAEITLAPNRLRYLRANWLTAIGVILPAFRAFRVFRVARALRGLNLVRFTTTLNRAARAAGHVAERGEMGYVLLLTVIVTAAAAAAVYFFERGIAASPIQTPWDSVWWAATIVTTINSPLEAVTLEGRLVALGLRIFALAFSGYLTAVIAVHLLGAGKSDEAITAERLERIERALNELRRASERRQPPAAHSL